MKAFGLHSLCVLSVCCLACSQYLLKGMKFSLSHNSTFALIRKNCSASLEINKRKLCFLHLIALFVYCFWQEMLMMPRKQPELGTKPAVLSSAARSGLAPRTVTLRGPPC